MEEWKKVASQLDKDHAKGTPARTTCTCTRTHMYASATPFSFMDSFFFSFFFLRVQEGESRHQEKVIRHCETAEEGEER